MPAVLLKSATISTFFLKEVEIAFLAFFGHDFLFGLQMKFFEFLGHNLGS